MVEGRQPPPSPPRSAGRGTTRSVVEGRRPHDSNPSTILRMVPLPIRYANREETRTAANPPIVSISHAANPLTPLIFQNKQRHKPSAPGPVSDSSHPVGGEGVGSSAPMSAGCGRAMKPGGRIPRGSLRRSMDGPRLLAARQWSGPLAVPCPSRVAGSNVGGGDPVRPEARAASRRARGKRLRGAAPSLPDRDFTGGSEGRPRSGFVETVKQSKLRARPGRPAPSPTFPAAMPESEDPWMEGGQWLVVGRRRGRGGRLRRPSADR